ncbi:MAG: MFS transporter [Chloroflexi bacterium]|nr:MFS transporter [Chloroflexota bacterium]
MEKTTPTSAPKPAEGSVTAPQKRHWGLLATLAGGHGITHLYQQAFPVLLAEIVRDLGLSSVAAGGLMSARTLLGGAVNFPVGLVSDTWPHRRSLLLMLSVAFFGVAFLLVPLAPSYALMAAAVALMGVGTSSWHPPSLSLLSRRFPDRRGFVVALHGVGGSVGDTIGPLAIGAMLLALTWRGAMQVSAIPAFVLAVAVWFLLRGAMKGAVAQKASLPAYGSALKKAARNLPFLLVVLASGLRSAGYATLITFFPIYLRQDLDFNPAVVGGYVALLTALGLASQPLLGVLSDRFGRKRVVVPGLVAVSLLSPLLFWAQPGWQLLLVVATMGLFVYAMSAILLALGMDLTGAEVQATTVGVLFASNTLFSSAAPLVAGALVASSGVQAAFYWVAVCFMASAIVILPLRVRPRPRAATGRPLGSA